MLFVVSTQRGYTCHPSGLACVDLATPRVIGSVVADAAGRAALSFVVPPLIPGHVYLEAVWVDAAAGTAGVSNLAVF